MDKLKKIFLAIIGLVVIVSTLLNVRNQYITLKEAENKNNELKQKIEKMTILKQKMIKQVEYATSSAFINQQTRQLLGLGDKNDVWLELPEEKKIEYIEKINEVKEIPNYQKWLNLFTQ